MEFWDCVERGPGCWLWTRATDGKGYGKFRNRPAHRVAYELTHGSIPEGQVVMHDCDTRPCVRPAHLRAGTQSANMRDAVRRGRMARQKLSVADVLDIRRRVAGGETQRAIAGRYGVRPPTVSQIVNRKRWVFI